MSCDQFRYRFGVGGWLPEIWPEQDTALALGAAGAVSNDGAVYASRQPIGFRGAAPGESRDARGRLRIRCKARSLPA